MKAEGKRDGTKAQVRAAKERQKRIGKAIFSALILTAILLSAFLAYSFIGPSSDQTIIPESSQPRAAIVDQLSLTMPNKTFIETATNILEQAGYNVDYYPGEQITVEFFKKLPMHGYGLIILRVHSTATGPSQKQAPVAFFTSERCDLTKHVYEQLNGQLVMVAFSSDELNKGITYFGIGPPFITNCMNGEFRNTVIIALGCQGLENTLMAKAFVEKGARIYVGWNGSVSASHTDTATTHLLQNFLIGKQRVEVAVGETLKEVGSDPVFCSQLIYYPP